MTTYTWETREQWGAVPPRNRRSDTSPRGVAIHYPGPGSFVFVDHDSCRRQMRDWQRQHMARGSNDLEYGAVLCHHLRLMEARIEQDKPWVRVGSNGTASANYTHTSIQLMRGTFDPPPTDQEVRALGEAVAWLRDKGGWGPEVTGHRDHFATACPGDPLYARLGDIRRIADEPTTPPKDKIVATANVPHRLGPANMLPDIERLRDSFGVTLTSVQECTDQDVPFYGQSLGWDWWRPDRAQSAGLLFDPDSWQPVRRDDGQRRQGSYRLHTRGVRTPPRFVVWADLWHVPSDEILRVGAFHLVAFKTRSARAAKEFLRQQGRLARWLRGGSNRVALGDLNGNRSIFWTPSLVKDAVWETPRLATKGRAKIDHVLRPKGQPQPQAIAAVDGHSDHRALVVRL